MAVLIGIDETGTVADGETVIVVVALVRPSALTHLEGSLGRWEKLTRRRLRLTDDEVKSTDLDEEARREFVNKVLTTDSNGIYYYCVAIEVDPHVLAWGEAQRDHFVNTLMAAADDAEEEGRRKWARQTRTMCGWPRRTPGGMMIKMTVLNIAIASSLNQAIGTSVAYGFDHELGELRYSIDQGFIRGGADFWQDTLRSHLAQSTQREPTIEVEGWADDHPFLRTFVAERVGDYRRLSTSFRDRLTFEDSTYSTPIRIADQVAGLMRRRVVHQERSAHLDRMKSRALRPETNLLQFNDLDAFEADSDDAVKNIYEEVERARYAVAGESDDGTGVE